MKIEWMKSKQDNCDHFNYNYIDKYAKVPNFGFNTWDECPYFTCSKCGKKFWGDKMLAEYNGYKIYKKLYPKFTLWLNNPKQSLNNVKNK